MNKEVEIRRYSIFRMANAATLCFVCLALVGSVLEHFIHLPVILFCDLFPDVFGFLKSLAMGAVTVWLLVVVLILIYNYVVAPLRPFRISMEVREPDKSEEARPRAELDKK